MIMYYYLDIAEAKLGRVLMLGKSNQRIPNTDSVYGAHRVVEYIGDKLPYGVVYEPKSNTVRAATPQERQRAALKRLYSGVSLLGKVWTKDDFSIDTFVKRAGDTVTGTLNITAPIPIKVAHGTGIHLYRNDGNTAIMGKTSGSEVTIVENASKSYIKSPCDVKGQLNVAGAMVAEGDVFAMSDRRIKCDIKPITNPFKYIDNMNGYYYKLNKDKSAHIGVIAQEIEPIMPELVGDVGDYKAVAYGNFAGLFIEALKELNIRLHKLEQIGGEHNE